MTVIMAQVAQLRSYYVHSCLRYFIATSPERSLHLELDCTSIFWSIPTVAILVMDEVKCFFGD